ncbi:MAG: hypothetical protein V1725_01890 [archaeon]
MQKPRTFEDKRKFFKYEIQAMTSDRALEYITKQLKTAKDADTKRALCSVRADTYLGMGGKYLSRAVATYKQQDDVRGLVLAADKYADMKKKKNAQELYDLARSLGRGPVTYDNRAAYESLVRHCRESRQFSDSARINRLLANFERKK